MGGTNLLRGSSFSPSILPCAKNGFRKGVREALQQPLRLARSHRATFDPFLPFFCDFRRSLSALRACLSRSSGVSAPGALPSTSSGVFKITVVAVELLEGSSVSMSCKISTSLDEGCRWGRGGDAMWV